MSESMRRTTRRVKKPLSNKAEKTPRDGKRSVSLPPITMKTDKTMWKSNSVPGWHKRPRSLEPVGDTFRTGRSKSTNGKTKLFKPCTTTHKDVWSIYNVKPRLPTPYRPESSVSRTSSRASRPGSSTSRIQEWHKGSVTAYDTISQRSMRADNIVKKFVSITNKFDRDAEKARKEKERKSREQRQKFLKDLKERRKDFAMRNYKRVDQQFVTPKVLEYEKDERDGYGLPQYLLLDIKYPTSKKKPNSTKTSKTQTPRVQKHSQLPPSTYYGVKTEDKSTRQKNTSTNNARSVSRPKNYQELYKIYCIPGPNKLRDWAKEENAALAIGKSKLSVHCLS